MTQATTQVNVHLAGDLRGLIGERTLALELPNGSTVRDVFTSLSSRYGEPFSVRVFTNAGALEHTIAVFVDGRNIQRQGGLDTALRPDEPAASDVEIFMLPIIEGG